MMSAKKTRTRHGFDMHLQALASLTGLDLKV